MGRVELSGRQKDERTDVSVALAGNPNVGKSTLFNTLTGLHRHTGNWAGKTVSIAAAEVRTRERVYSVADIPGAYSLLSHSKEEEIARNYICFGGADITVAVCDATSLERSLALVLQIREVTGNLIVAVNLMDEAERAGISIDLEGLSRLLGVPVVGVVARRKRSLASLLRALDGFKGGGGEQILTYSPLIEDAVAIVERSLSGIDTHGLSKRWLALRLIEADPEMNLEISEKLGMDISSGKIFAAVQSAKELLFLKGIDSDFYKDEIVCRVIDEAERIARATVSSDGGGARERTRRIDRILTGRVTAYPVMLLMLFAVLWITMVFAAYPSDALASLFSYAEGLFVTLLVKWQASELLIDILVYGIYRTASTVVAVMLPPMAIFFPLFNLLEDSGYLPRVAYNLDRPFAACGACGKQALTMCMGLGCNAVGITGARIIDSRRERLLAILTNSFIPCNGRLPMLVSIIGIWAILAVGGESVALTVLALAVLIMLSVGATLLVTMLLSKTVLSGERSSFTIEMPPYRRPEFLKVILNSLRTKVAAVLGRAIIVAAPMGALIAVLGSVTVGGESLISHAASFLDPLGALMGMDGEILLAFILGWPANEIVIPILIMLYTAEGSFGAELGTSAMSELFMANGWDGGRAVCVAIFALFHWPCSTSVITVYKETGSIKYTVMAAILPTFLGFLICTALNILI